MNKKRIVRLYQLSIQLNWVHHNNLASLWRIRFVFSSSSFFFFVVIKQRLLTSQRSTNVRYSFMLMTKRTMRAKKERESSCPIHGIPIQFIHMHIFWYFVFGWTANVSHIIIFRLPLCVLFVCIHFVVRCVATIHILKCVNKSIWAAHVLFKMFLLIASIRCDTKSHGITKRKRSSEKSTTNKRENACTKWAHSRESHAVMAYTHYREHRDYWWWWCVAVPLHEFFFPSSATISAKIQQNDKFNDKIWLSMIMITEMSSIVWLGANHILNDFFRIHQSAIHRTFFLLCHYCVVGVDYIWNMWNM